MEEVLGNDKAKFKIRYIEGYKDEKDAIYNAWKILHCEWNRIRDEIAADEFRKSNLEQEINPIICKILQYPSVERNKKNSKKKITIPKHMSSIEAVALLKVKEDEKRRIAIEREARRQKVEKNKIKEPLKKKKKISPPTATSTPAKRKSSRVSKKKKFTEEYSVSSCEEDTTEEEILSSTDDDSSSENDEDPCKKCKKKFKNGELWVSCDTCETWFHAACTNQRKKTK